jgi:GTP pyrophosphokinase
VTLTRKLVQIQRAARDAQVGAEHRALQTERVRKMLLAFSRDLRVVLLRLASRLQTLRWHAAARRACPAALALESQQVFAPLANRLGIWQIKWELEDLAFRFLEPGFYRHIAHLLDEKRSRARVGCESARQRLATLLSEARLRADVQGRPKHLYSIWKKMQGKGCRSAQVFDVRALRVIVDDVPPVMPRWRGCTRPSAPVEGEFDDYIARPKPNGYQSLHTVVLADDGRPWRCRSAPGHARACRARRGRALDVQGSRRPGLCRCQRQRRLRAAPGRGAQGRAAQLLAWERDFASGGSAVAGGGFDDRIYVFTPQATIIDLPSGRHAGRLRLHAAHRPGPPLPRRAGRRRMVPLNTPLQHGQTVEVVAAKEGGPSMDWLNPELGYLQSPRARAKVRAWFNAQALDATIARGRELVEKLLQREGRTALKLEHLAEQLGFKSADALFEVVGKDEFSLRNIENLLRPARPPQPMPRRRCSSARAATAGPAACWWWAWVADDGSWRAAAGRHRPMPSAASSRAARAWPSTAATAATSATWRSASRGARSPCSGAMAGDKPPCTRWT